MSDLAAAAAKLGVSESILKRSAEARANATGVSVDALLEAWAGGAAAPTPSEPVTSPPPPVTSPEPPAESPAPTEAPAAPAATPTPQPKLVTGDRRPETDNRRPETGDSVPVLVGRREGIGLTMTGSVGLLVLSMLLGFFLPSVPQPSNGVRSSNHAFSRAALTGRDIYLEEGCGSCHTQLIRNVVPDAKLGPVTLDDTNQVIGYRRIGPDLAAIGSRITDTAALTALLAGERNHPTAALSNSELAELLAYLRESR
jgi:hypothetical protein